MKFKYLMIACTLFLISSGPLVAWGIPDDAPPVAVLKAVLDLSQEQIEEIRGLVEARGEAIGPLAEQIKMLERELEEELNSDAPDAVEVGNIVLEIRMLRQEVGQHKENFRMAFQALLSEEQLERIAHIYRVALAVRAAKALGQLRLH